MRMGESVTTAAGQASGDRCSPAFVAGLALAAGVHLAAESRADDPPTYRWTNTTNLSNWFDIGDNWSPTGPPGAGDAAVFDTAASYTVAWDSVTGDRQNAELTVDAGDVTFHSVGGTFTYAISGEIDVDGATGGTLTLGSSEVNPHILQSDGGLTLRSGGTLNVRFGSEVTVDHFWVGRAAPGPTLATLLVDGPGSSLNTTGATWHNRVGTRGGHLIFQNGATGNFPNRLRIGEGVVDNNHGYLSVLSGSTLTLGSLAAATSGDPTHSATINIQGAGSSIVQNSGALTLGYSADSPATLNIGTVSGDADTAYQTVTTDVVNVALNRTGTLNIGGDTFGQRGAFNAHTNVVLVGGTINRGIFGNFNLAAGRYLGAGQGATVSFAGNYTLANDNTFTFASGSSFATTGHLDIGGGGADGTLVVQGAGSSLSVGSTGFSAIGSSSNTGSLTLEDSATGTYSGSLYLARHAGSTGNLSVTSDASLTIPSLYVGGTSSAAGGTGAVNVHSGGKLDAGHTLKLWNDGTLNLADFASRVSASTLEIAGGELTRTAGGLVVSDDLSVMFNNFEIGRDNGHGELSITDGGKLNNMASVGDAVLMANAATASATAEVSGAGSSWTNAWSLNVARQGQATLTIDAGGSVNNQVTIIGEWEGADGTATVRGTSSTLSNEQWIMVGNEGTGTLNLEGGGWASNTHAYVGLASSGKGTVNITNPGSRWINAGSVHVGGNETAAGGQGTVDVSNNGWLVIDDALKIWNEGQVSLTGSGSRIRASSIEIVGGQLTRTDINALIVSDTIFGSIQNFFEIGRNDGTGTVSVTGGGTLSNSGEALMSVSAGSTALATVAGAGSTWINQSLVVGQFGSAELHILGGAQVSGVAGYLGYFFSGAGQATISGWDEDGQASTWANTGSLYVGGRDDAVGGMGTLIVRDNGRVTAEGSAGVHVWADGMVTGADGTVEAPVMVNRGRVSPGDGQTGGDTGVLRLVGDYEQSADGTLAIWLDGAAPSHLAVTGDANVAGSISVHLVEDRAPAYWVAVPVLIAEGAAGVAGVFDELVPPAAPGNAFRLSYEPDRVLLTAGLLGDMNLDGVVDTGDVAPFVQGLTDPPAYEATYGIDPAWPGDVNQDGAFDTGDVAAFVQLLVDGSTAVPEPGAATLWLLGAAALLRPGRIRRGGGGS